MSQTRSAPTGTTTVRAVVVTWRAADSLGDALASILGQETDADVRVVVVDNDADGPTRSVLAAFGDRISVRRLAQNTGFAGGVTAGTWDATEDFLLLLNDDATMEPDALEHLLATVRAPGGERVGAVTATILLASRYRLSEQPAPGGLTDGTRWAVPDPSGEVLVNSTGNVLDPAGRGSDRDWLVPLDSLDSPREVFGFCGGAALLRTSAVLGVGGFDPTLFLYYEDTDLSWRLRRAGWSVVWASHARAHHRHAASTGTGSPVFRYYNTRNALRVAARYAPLRMVGAGWARALGGAARDALTLVRALLRSPSVGATAPDSALVRARLHALAAALTALPRDLHHRFGAHRAARGGRGDRPPRTEISVR